MQKVGTTYSFIADSPNMKDHFLLSVGQDQLGENCQTQDDVSGSLYTLSLSMHYIFETFRIDNTCQVSPPAW